MRKTKTTKAKRTTTVRGTQYEYTVVFEPAEEGGYVVTVPALPGLHTEGGTFEEGVPFFIVVVLRRLQVVRLAPADIQGR
ncbi:MAG TPA: type II toxin-antitoxin system HicB family antitoxin [Candidatus Acidoferrales bacterium]|nr:type II toxin-antitoxin system HicB family antitoxin [Candidatus Acidoferrales bacterium]